MIDKAKAALIFSQVLAGEVSSETGVPRALRSIIEPEDQFPCPRLDAIGSDNNIRFFFPPIRKYDTGFVLVEGHHFTSGVKRNRGIADSLQERLVVVAPVANVPSHVHQRLLCEYFAVSPAADLHILCLVSYAGKAPVEVAATPSLKQLQRVFAESKGVPKPFESAQLLVQDHVVAMVLHRQSTRAAAQAGADDDHSDVSACIT